MRPEERLGLAGEAYLRAISVARRQPTSASWGRLLTAARNLRTARRDRERERSRPRAASLAMRADGRAAGPAARRKEPSPPGSLPVVAGHPTYPVKAGGVTAAPSTAHGFGLGRWSELVKEWQRAGALREQSHRLVAESRALCAAIATLARARPSMSQAAGGPAASPDPVT